MAVEATPATWAAVFKAIDAQAQLKGRAILTALAGVLETQAKTNASAGAHPYGTTTPAHPGTGPAVISGNLRRSITHEPVRTLGPGHWQTRVGTATGFSPPYGGRSRTPANRYGYYLEHGLRNGMTYPFLRPAFKHTVETAAPTLFRAAFGTGTWRKVT